jgi:hypothetical protein
MLWNRFLPLALLVGACAPSPLYVGAAKTRGTVGEVPRDGSGEPIWTSIRPVPLPEGTPPLPPAPGLPIIPAPQS